MAARLIDGKAVATRIRERVAREVAEMPSPPGLATILVGDDPASEVYVRMKREDSAEVGIESFHHEPGGDVSQEELAGLIRSLNEDERVHGILLQLPLPGHLDQDPLISLIDPAKDVDGLTPVSAGLLTQGREGAIAPCTPAGAPHHYTFTLIGTDLEPAALQPGMTRDELIKALDGHAKGATGIIGTFSKP